jgi:PST family polysaccharide transporter
MSQNLTTKVRSGVFWVTSQQVVQQVSNFLVFVVLARLLGPDSIGLVAFAGLFVAFTMIFAIQGFTEAIVQRNPLEPEHLDSAFWGNFAVGIFLTAFGILVAPFLARLFREPQLAAIIRWMSLSFILTCLSAVQSSLLRRELRFKSLAVRGFIAELSGGVVGIAMAVGGMGAWSLVGMRLTNTAVSCLVLWQVSSWRPRLRFSKSHYLDLFNFGSSIMGVNICGFFYTRAADLMIGYFLGPVALGYYTAVSSSLQKLSNLFMGTISQVAMPAFAKLQMEPKRVLKGYFRATELASLAAFPAFIGIALLAPEIVTGLFGQKWTPSIPVLTILALIGVRDAVVFLDNQVLTALGKPSWRFRLTLLHNLVNVTAIAVGASHGILGVAIGRGVAALLTWPASLGTVRKILPFPVIAYFSRYRVPLLASLGMAVVVTGYRLAVPGNNPLLFLVGGVFSGSCAYALIVLWLAPETLSKISRSGPLPALMAAVPISLLKHPRPKA